MLICYYILFAQLAQYQLNKYRKANGLACSICINVRKADEVQPSFVSDRFWFLGADSGLGFLFTSLPQNIQHNLKISYESTAHINNNNTYVS
mmetsp:Transcript_33687/g.46994  ORF Transcript_33687/g.46994 Transcript_33687/m.46994 type:complete len:92 (+) Transcript_33687:126-401(+)